MIRIITIIFLMILFFCTPEKKAEEKIKFAIEKKYGIMGRKELIEVIAKEGYDEHFIDFVLYCVIVLIRIFLIGRTSGVPMRRARARSALWASSFERKYLRHQ